MKLWSISALAAYTITATSSSGFRCCKARNAPSASGWRTGRTLSVRSNRKTSESGSSSWLNDVICCRTPFSKSSKSSRRNAPTGRPVFLLSTCASTTTRSTRTRKTCSGGAEDSVCEKAGSCAFNQAIKRKAMIFGHRCMRLRILLGNWSFKIWFCARICKTPTILAVLLLWPLS